MTHHVFVYGTLRPGDVRWHVLEPFTIDGGTPDSVSGELFDTGLDYPAAVFGPDGTILGHTFALLEATLDRAIAVLDEVEDIVGGEYHRVTVRTHRGRRRMGVRLRGRARPHADPVRRLARAPPPP